MGFSGELRVENNAKASLGGIKINVWVIDMNEGVNVLRKLIYIEWRTKDNDFYFQRL